MNTFTHFVVRLALTFSFAYADACLWFMRHHVRRASLPGERTLMDRFRYQMFRLGGACLEARVYENTQGWLLDKHTEMAEQKREA